MLWGGVRFFGAGEEAEGAGQDGGGVFVGVLKSLPVICVLKLHHWSVLIYVFL